MKTIVHLGIPMSYPANEAARTAVIQFCRENRLKFGLVYADVDETDPRKTQLLNLLASYGFTLKPSEIGEMTEEDARRYVLHYRETVFQTDDWETAEYLRLWPEQYIEFNDMLRWEEEMHFSGQKLPEWLRRVDFARTMHSGLDAIISDRARRILESAGLTRLKFGRVHFHDLPGAPLLWELDSDLMLPPVSDTVPLFNFRKEPIKPGDISQGWMGPRPNDGIICYRRSAIESLRPFDIARTLEPWGPPSRPNHPRNDLLVSKRFYQVCQDNGLQTYWIPVRIED